MRYRARTPRSPAFGVALSEAGIFAIRMGASGEPALEATFTDWREELAPAFARLALPGAPSTAHVAVHGTLCVSKDVRLPPLSGSERARLLATVGSGHLPLPPGPLAVATPEIETDEAYRVHAMTAANFEVIHEAAAEAGLQVESVVAGRSVLALAIREAFGPEPTVLFSMTGRRAEGLVLRDGCLLEVHQRLCTSRESLRGFTTRVLDPTPRSMEIERIVLGADGPPSFTDYAGDFLKIHDDSISVESEFDCALAAATHAGESSVWLSTERQQEERRRARLKSALNRVVMAVVLIALSRATTWWGISRELAHLRADRAGIRSEVEAAVELEARIRRVEGTLADIRAADYESPDWGRPLATLAIHLPREARLLRFVGAGDSIAIEGVGPNASVVFSSLSAARGLRDVVASAPVRRELSETGASRDWFAVSARHAPGEPGAGPAEARPATTVDADPEARAP